MGGPESIVREGDAGAAGLLTRRHVKDHEGDGGPEIWVWGVTAIRCVWPLAGWGADPQGIKPADLSVHVMCVGVSALPTIHRKSAAKKHAEWARHLSDMYHASRTT